MSVSRAQIQLDFTVGITEQYPDLMDVIRAACDPGVAGKQKKAIAADLDWSPSEFARAINENGDRPLKVADLPALLDALPHTRHLVIEWLVERYLDANTNQVQRAAEVIKQLAPTLQRAIETIERYGGEGGRKS